MEANPRAEKSLLLFFFDDCLPARPSPARTLLISELCAFFFLPTGVPGPEVHDPPREYCGQAGRDGDSDARVHDHQPPVRALLLAPVADAAAFDIFGQTIGIGGEAYFIMLSIETHRSTKRLRVFCT